jgi:hypothetical protein
MLSSDTFEQWGYGFTLLDEAKTIIVRLRSSPLSRLVRSAAGNVSLMVSPRHLSRRRPRHE